MMISTKGRYALRVMLDLCEHQTDGYLPLKEIAQRQEISEKYLETILKVLVQNHFLTGLRGKGGGYRLTKTPDQYSVGSILRLAEGSLSPVACLELEPGECPRMESCPTRPMWEKLDQLITDYFDNISLADLITSPQSGNNKQEINTLQTAAQADDTPD